MKIEKRLLGLKAICNQSRKQVDEKVGNATMARMLDLGNVLELIIDGFNNRPLEPQNSVQSPCDPRHKNNDIASIGFKFTGNFQKFLIFFQL
jgi:hypothetical protein